MRIFKESILICVALAGLVHLVHADESISNGKWKVSCGAGEIRQASFNDTPLIAKLGNFRVAGRKVSPFKDVSELREKGSDRLVYEGIADDGQNMYVEFGVGIKIGTDLEILVFLEWLPPSPWPPDAIEGVLNFSEAVVSLERVKIPAEDAVIPGTQDFAVKLRSGREFRMRALGLDGKNTGIKKNGQRYSLFFQETRDYVPRKNTSHSYWMTSTDSHYIKFTISAK